MSDAHEVVVIETPVTDYLYDEARADVTLRDEFLIFLKPDQPPTKGDNITVSYEEWRAKLLDFAAKKQLVVAGFESEDDATSVREQIFGAPRAIEAGGSAANSFDLMVKATIDGVPLTDGVFVTALGEGESGRVFADSLVGRVVSPPPQGHQMEAHIFPIDGDRIIVTVPSFENPPYKAMSAAQLDEVRIGANTRMVVLGGYMDYTGKFNEFFDALLKKMAAVSDDPAQRPTLVLTAAAQAIAAGENLRHALTTATGLVQVVVNANTGEFRRLIGMDTEWRQLHEAKWYVKSGDGLRRLEGKELEETKSRDADYQAAKLVANEVAYKVAYETFCRHTAAPVTFVVTNGKKGVHVVNAAGISPTYVPPKPPHGVVNTVGGGDAFAGGYWLGHCLGLPQDMCATLGFVAAGEVIGQDEARLKPREREHAAANGRKMILGGLFAYFDPTKPEHAAVLERIELFAPERGIEAERKFLVIGDEWKKAIRQTFDITQHYLPSRAESGVVLKLVNNEGQYLAELLAVDGAKLAVMPVPKEKMDQFGEENLPKLFDQDGSMIQSETVEARVRFKAGHPLLTIKAETSQAGRRHELEFNIAKAAANVTIQRCMDSVTKTRHEVAHGKDIWEVDVYGGANEGLVTAELEGFSASTSRPAWVGGDITADRRYANRTLARNPYTKWAL